MSRVFPGGDVGRDEVCQADVADEGLMSAKGGRRWDRHRHAVTVVDRLGLMVAK